MEELKPCPFCGRQTHWVEDIYEDDERRFYVFCNRCGSMGAWKHTAKEAIASWNTRTERTCKVRQSYFDSDDELSELMECIAFSPEDTVVCICDTCKHDWRYDRGIRPNYCPNCGAKVISGKDNDVSTSAKVVE